MPLRAAAILIVDDDDDLRTELAEQLALEGFEAEQASTAAEGLEAARNGGAALALLDVHLPDMDGRELCRQLRRDGVRMPVIMLTGNAGEDGDIVLGLDSGANDYVIKPFKFAVLLARIRAHLRSHESSEDATYAVGPYEFRPSQKLLQDPRRSNDRIRLTDKETAILKYLYRAGAKSVAREELLREVWGYNASVSTHTLETHIYRLRQKIEPDAAQPRFLVTEQGGYRLAP